jgi:asparagine N-glycosylation enzyme membrane subunit Stt3
MGFLVLWITFRSFTSLPSLFPEEGDFRLGGADSYFHLRHSEYALEHYPEVDRYDELAYYPGVERGLNQGFYDLTVATVSKLSFGFFTPKMVLLCVSPVLTGLGLLLLAGVLWKRVSPWCGTLFGGFILTYPGPLIQVAALGNGDHHGFEVFLTICLAISLSKALETDSQWYGILVPSLVLFYFFLSWAGAPLHLAIVGLCFYASTFYDRTPEEKRNLAIKGVVFGALTSLLPFLAMRVSQNLILWKQSYDVFLAGGIGLLGFPILAYFAPKIPKKARLLIALGIVCAIPLAAQLTKPTAIAFEQFFRVRSFSISEHGPISAYVLFSWYGLNIAAILSTPIILLRGKNSREGIIMMVYGLALFLFWIRTRDFNYYAPPVVAAFAAYSLCQLPWKKWNPILLISLVALPLLPFRVPVYPWLLPLKAREAVIHTNGLHQAAAWLAEYKRTEGKDETYGIMAPWDLGSILAYETKTPVGWSQTHSKFLAQLFNTYDPDEVYHRLGRQKRPFKFVLVPSRNVEEKFGTEYMVSGRDPSTLFDPGPKIEWAGHEFQLPVMNENYGKTFIARLFNTLGASQGHFRLVFESPQQMVRAVKLHDDLKNFEFASLEVSAKEAEALEPILRRRNVVQETSRGLLVNPRLSPDVRVFEFVPGALLVGRTEKHARVGAYLSVVAPYDRTPKLITWKTYANANGWFRLRVPYATTGPVHQVPGSVEVITPYIFDIGGVKREVHVTEEQIQSRGKVRVNVDELPPPSEFFKNPSFEKEDETK